MILYEYLLYTCIRYSIKKSINKHTLNMIEFTATFKHVHHKIVDIIFYNRFMILSIFFYAYIAYLSTYIV